MRIAIVSETYPPEVNGVALTVQGLAQGLATLNHRVQLIRPQQGLSTAERATPEAADEILLSSARIPRYPELRFGFPARRRLRKLWQAERPDAVYVATEGPLGWSALREARSMGIPVGSGFHTRFDDFAAHYGLGFLSPLVFKYLRRFHNAADATLVPTQQLADFLISKGFTNVALLRRAVDTELFSPSRRAATLRADWGIAPEQLAVLFLGRIAEEKNLDLAVRAFRALQTQVPAARYVWVGDGPARARIAAQNPDFVFTGIQRGLDLAGHVASADLFLFPSLTETFGNVTLEALASGVPSVTFDYGAAREHIVDGINGRKVAFGDAAAFVAAACQVAGDPVLRQALRPLARLSVAELNPATVARQFAALLARLAAREVA